MTTNVSIGDIVAYIDRLTWNMLDRPEMWAVTPVTLELLIVQLEEIRSFALTGKPGAYVRETPYLRYLETRGFGAAMYTTNCTAPDWKSVPHSRREEFDGLCKFVQQFLNNEGRQRVEETKDIESVGPPGGQ